MLRALAGLLLLANLVFLAWTQSWLAPWLPPPGASEREPERLRLQVRPESVIVLSPQAVSAAASTTPPVDSAASESAGAQAAASGPPVSGAAVTDDRAAAAPTAVGPGQDAGGQGQRSEPRR